MWFWVLGFGACAPAWRLRAGLALARRCWVLGSGCWVRLGEGVAVGIYILDVRSQIGAEVAVLQGVGGVGKPIGLRGRRRTKGHLFEVSSGVVLG